MAKNRRSANKHGYIVIDKPAGWTSHDVVSRVRRIVGERRVGHAGTLDPGAVGVLPVAVGLATRTVEYLAESTKTYRAWITFGVTTDTADGDGVLQSTHDASNLTREQLDHALEAFRGEIDQRPPMYSAIQIDGQRLYDLARKGVEVEIEPRKVTILDLTVVDWSLPVLCIDVECSKGTYIRSLARDLGDAVGTGAYLSHLVRTCTGPFRIDQALTMDELEQHLESDGWEMLAFHPDWVLQELTAIVLGVDESIWWRQGKPINIGDAVGATATVRAYDASGRWLGVGAFDAADHLVRPVKVIPTE